MNEKIFKNHFDSGLHNFVKKGKVKSKGLGGENYTEYECSNCGLKARMYKAEKKEKILTFVANFNRRDVQACKYPISYTPPKRIEIIGISGPGTTSTRFREVVPGSRHDVVKPAGWFLNDHHGVWIQGIGSPVKIYSHEFMEVKVYEFTRNKKKRKKKRNVTFHRG